MTAALKTSPTRGYVQNHQLCNLRDVGVFQGRAEEAIVVLTSKSHHIALLVEGNKSTREGDYKLYWRYLISIKALVVWRNG